MLQPLSISGKCSLNIPYAKDMRYKTKKKQGRISEMASANDFHSLSCKNICPNSFLSEVFTVRSHLTQNVTRLFRAQLLYM